MKRPAALLSLVLVGSCLPLAACSTSPGQGEAGPGGTREAVIGVMATLSGTDGQHGKGAVHAVELAARQANESGRIPGWRLTVASADDKGEAADAVTAAGELAGNDAVVGVVGGLWTGVSGAAAPVFAEASIGQVSPTASNPALTRGQDFAKNPTRPHATFFRVCPPDDVYGPTLSAHLLAQGTKRIVTVHDDDTYGKGLVDAVTRDFEAKGGTVVLATSGATREARAALVGRIAALAPQAIIFGGYDADGAAFSQALKSAGVHVPLVGGDTLYTDDYLTASGPLSAGDLAIMGGRPTEDSDAGRAFRDAYRAQRFDAPIASESPYAYDAAQAIIAALAETLPRASSAKEARGATVEALSKVTLDGVNGPIRFDRFGENQATVITVYRVHGGRWATERTIES